jgi:hypothetical protein
MVDTTITSVVNTPSDQIVTKSGNNIFVGSNTFTGSVIINSNIGVGTNTPGDLITAGSWETPTTSNIGDKTIGIYGVSGAYFRGRDIANDIEFIMGVSSTGQAFAGAMTNNSFDLRTNNTSNLLLSASGVWTNNLLASSGITRAVGLRSNSTTINEGVAIDLVASTDITATTGRISAIRKGTGGYGDMAFSTQNSSNVLTEAVRINSSQNVGIGTTAPLGVLHATASTLATVAVMERTITSAVDNMYGAGKLLATKSTDMGDGFGPSMALSIKDDAGVVNDIALFGAVRANGSDTKGDFIVGVNGGTGVIERLRLNYLGNVGIGTTTPEGNLHVLSSTFPVGDFTRTSSDVSNVLGANKLERLTTGTALSGIGIGQYFAIENGIGTSVYAGLIGARLTSVTNGSETMQLVFNTRDAGGDPSNSAYTRIVIDGTGNVGIGTTTPRSTLEVNGVSTFGSGNNYVQISSDGHISLIGSATLFRDELGDVTKLKVQGVGITDNASESAVTFLNSTNLNDYLYTNIQLNHDRKLSGNVYPHLHWFQIGSATNGSAVTPNWFIQYRWQINGGSIVPAWTNSAWTKNAFNSTGSVNQLTMFSTITAPSGNGLSDILQFKIFRYTGSSIYFASDPVAGDVSATSFDVHIELDSFGSNSEYVK